MGQFFKTVFATLIGLFIFTFLGIIIFVGIIVSSSSSETTNNLKSNSVLKLDINSTIVESHSTDRNPISKAVSKYTSSSTLGLFQILDGIRSATKNDKIKGIYLKANHPMAGYAQLEEIRNALLEFKKSGKFVYAYGSYTQKGYYVSSVADKIFLPAEGTIEFVGLSANIMFYKGLLDKLEVKPVIFKVGEYKSFVEPYTQNKMSEPNREQITSFLNSINSYVFTEIAKSRKTSYDSLMRVANSLTSFTPEGALKAHLVTNIGYFDEFESEIKKTLTIKDTEKINYCLVENIKLQEKTREAKIAVVWAEGSIMGENAQKTAIGSESFIKQLKQAREDKQVKAIVIRINSPGGSASASDFMWREIELTKKIKPVVASMSAVAASGGYYMAMGADEIVASPTTLTGSIGVFGMLFSTENLFKNKLGITFDGVKTNTHSDFPTLTREMDASEKNVFQKSVERIYQVFTTKAAQGRKMPLEKLKMLARGRVWTGLQAKENGLIDALGGLEDAVRRAAKRGNVAENSYDVQYFPEEKSFFEDLFEEKSSELEEKMMQEKLGEWYVYTKEIQKLQAMQGVLTLMPFSLE